MSDLLANLRNEARLAPESGIVEVINAGREHKDLIPLWAGEGDLPTPGFICDAAKASLDAGETFYTYQRGIPDLRKALADYHARTYGRTFSPERFFVTGSGMQAIQIAVQCVAGKGDEVVYPSPAWPNLAAAVEIMGAQAVPVAMTQTAAGWTLDLDRIFSAITPRTKALFLNSPCNPTGWVASAHELQEILEECRKRGIWIIADEVYGRFHFGEGSKAPSFYDLADEDDKILFVNTFSKNWAMTGWRIGWLSAPPSMGQVIENLIQYSTSGVPVFSQRGALAALEQGDAFLDAQIARAKDGRRIVMEGLAQAPLIKMSVPDGAFYLFFSVDGISDARNLALDLVRETGVGLAPGSAFGQAGNGFLRLCFARDTAHLEAAVARIVKWVAPC
ncbi:pyridoxal phosphate-dependent aminotransferase [Roseibium sp.]|uniref:pyridoxal phosphate-dependent aminotransferase n=1 Tax=Roseibium sp. TaxID=1936156 RepID=UPI003A974600